MIPQIGYCPQRTGQVLAVPLGGQDWDNATMSGRGLSVLIASQSLFTSGDLLARANMSRFGFTGAAFIAPWFVAWFILRQLGGIGQLYVLSQVPAGTTLSLFSAFSIVLVNILAVLLLKELLSPLTYLGVSLAVASLVVLSVRPH